MCPHTLVCVHTFPPAGLYTEATSEGMRLLCERAGFRLRRSLQHRQGAPKTLLMTREPVTVSLAAPYSTDKEHQ